MKITNKIFVPVLLFTSFLVTGCKKFVSIDAPKDQIIDEKVYSNDETAVAAIRGIYAKMLSANGFASGGANSVTLVAGRSADEFTNTHGTESYLQFSTNNLLPDNSFLRTGLWQEPYQCIYFANLILENLERSTKVSDLLKRQLQGEAKFIRAFCHFYLTNLFGEIPYVLTTDYRINASISASSKDQIYAYLINDLLEAHELLSDSYPTVERTRPNKYVATALLARVYLYNQKWVEAEAQASALITKTDQYQLADDLNKVFLKNSQEAIWQFIVPPLYNTNTFEGQTFILTSAPGTSTHVVLSQNLISAFEAGDQRLNAWVGTFSSGSSSWKFPFKYKVRAGSSPLNEYSMVFRLAEQYLIRAEARINQNKIALGIDDLNSLRERARALPTTSVPNPLPILSIDMTKTEALLSVEKERRIELFSEWGHRWLDLKRTERADAVLLPLKGANWQSTDGLYPIPLSELANNQHLIQNKGY